jgi:hypothetical protein
MNLSKKLPISLSFEYFISQPDFPQVHKLIYNHFKFLQNRTLGLN